MSRTGGGEGPVCTSEVLGARKIGEEPAEVAWPRSLTDGGFTPQLQKSSRRSMDVVFWALYFFAANLSR
jgi:hypothetical protein